MLRPMLPPEYKELVDIFVPSPIVGEKETLAEAIYMFIVPKQTIPPQITQQPGFLDINYDFDGIFEQPINNLPVTAVVKRADGTELTILNVRRVGQIQIVSLKKMR